jgi:hypothetical protein
MSSGAVANDQVQTGLAGKALRHGDVNERLTYLRKPTVWRQCKSTQTLGPRVRE